MLQQERRRHPEAGKEGPHMILGTYSAILSDTHVFRDKGNLSFASPPSHLSIGRLTCGVTNCFMTARMLETIYFSLDL